MRNRKSPFCLYITHLYENLAWVSVRFRVVVRSVLEGGRVSVILDGWVAHAQPEVGFSRGFNEFFLGFSPPIWSVSRIVVAGLVISRREDSGLGIR